MKRKERILIIGLILLVLFLGAFLLYQRGIIFPKVSLSNDSLTLLVGDNAILSYETNNTNKSTSWHSEDESIVQIDSNGYITALKNGKTRIYLQYDNQRKYCDIVVNDILASSILLSQHNISLSVSETYELTYTISPTNVTDNSVTWDSSNPSVVSINNGIVTANSIGTATITVTTSNGIKDSCEITVDSIKVKELKLTKDNVSLNIGGKYKIDAIVLPNDATDKVLTYETNNPNVIEITKDGLVTGKQPGNAKVTISSINGVKATCNITVTDNVSITYNIKSSSLFKKTNIVISSNNNDLNYQEMVINTYYNGAVVKDKSISKKVNSYTVSVDKVGKWEIEAYLVYGDNIYSQKFKNTYTIATLSSVKNALSSGVNKITFDENSKVLLFGSDFQGGSRETSIKNILSTINKQGVKPGLITFLGDYASSGVNTSVSNTGISKLTSIFRSYSNLKNSGIIYVQGNHDPADVSHLVSMGEYEATNYALFAFNEDDYPASAGNTKTARIKEVANRLDSYLKKLVSYKIKKPVFVVTHVPLHYSSRGDNPFASYIVDVLNKYGNSLDIFFMYGHNHSQGYDDCLGGSINYISKGSKMKYFRFNESTKSKVSETKVINFTYLNAGYVGYNRNSSKVVSCSGTKVQSSNLATMTVFTIQDKRIVIERYGEKQRVSTTNINRVN